MVLWSTRLSLVSHKTQVNARLLNLKLLLEGKDLLHEELTYWLQKFET